jgi:hypothetical protein
MIVLPQLSSNIIEEKKWKIAAGLVSKSPFSLASFSGKPRGKQIA